jgi:CRP/FNR family transcriptional regulator
MSTSTGFTRYAPLGNAVATSQPAGPRSLMEVIRGLEGASTEMVERNKTIFFPGRPGGTRLSDSTGRCAPFKGLRIW